MKTMASECIEWRPFFDGKIILKYAPKKDYNNSSNVTLYAAGGLGIAAALEPFKLIIAECADPVCFIGGAMGLYRISIGQREEGFKQVLNAALAQIGFFVWPMLQAAIRASWGV